MSMTSDNLESGEALRDRWLEGDFRFFDKQDPQPQVEAFMRHFADFYKGGADGEVGIMLNVGWFADVVLAYPGSLDEPIPLAVFKPLFGENSGQTLGDDLWTYRQIAGVVAALREGARRILARSDFRVGVLMLGWSSIYYAHTPVWFKRHRESFRWARTNRTDPHYLFLDWSCRLRPDACRYAAFPDGIPQAIPLPEFFARQWACFCADTGFDTINLRDGMLGLANYRHASPAWDEACFEGVRMLLREIKRHAPGTRTIGYSVAGSAMAELRCHSLDLRTLAKDGCLDAWITQSWGCNWIEQKRLELTPAMQLATILTHRALLEGTGVKHYVVLNMLDAYEFLTLKPFSDRWEALKWEIWAYTHAALVRYWNGEGTWGLREGHPLSLASGLYGAWFHVREQMLDVGSTRMLTAEIEVAVGDARAMVQPGGPELVIHDDYVRELNVSDNPFAYGGEHVDEAAGLLIRAGVSILSSSRILERDFKANRLPLILHHPVRLPLDVRAELAAANVVLVVGTKEHAEPFGVAAWNPADGFDPLGDAAALRENPRPEDAVRMAELVRRGDCGPRLEEPAGACIHFHYWKNVDGGWSILLGNIEVGALDGQVRIVFPEAWLSEQFSTPVFLSAKESGFSPIAVAPDAPIQPLLLEAGTSLLLRLAPAR